VSDALQIVVNSPGNIKDVYIVRDYLLGEGNFGKVRPAVMKATGAPRAVKCIPKTLLKNKSGGVKQEVQIMKLIDHPNLVMLYDIFEDDDSLYLVMELCAGGHLLELMQRTKCFTELETAVAMQQILRAIKYLHSHQIAHRDVKAENCLVSSKGRIEHGRVKVGDFGLSRQFKPNEVFTARVGTPTHWAPEVLERKYTKKCDLWACGVVMYHILSGSLPFSDENDCEEVRKGMEVPFCTPAWCHVSDDAALLTNLLMTRDASKRPSARRILRDEWFARWIPKVEDAPFKKSHLANLRNFRSLSRLKRASLAVVVTLLGDRDIRSSRKLFASLDRNGDGLLSVVELRRRLKRCRNQEELGSVQDIFQDGDPDQDRLRPFTFTEFLAATFAREHCLDDNLCRAAFRMFDKHGDGQISIADLASGKLLGHLSLHELRQLMEDLGPHASTVEFEAFVHMLRSQTV